MNSKEEREEQREKSLRQAAARARMAELMWDNPYCEICGAHHPPDACISGKKASG